MKYNFREQLALTVRLGTATETRREEKSSKIKIAAEPLARKSADWGWYRES